jgi:hypothetical protein
MLNSRKGKELMDDGGPWPQKQSVVDKLLQSLGVSLIIFATKLQQLRSASGPRGGGGL